jgi:hypothetical protein
VLFERLHARLVYEVLCSVLAGKPEVALALACWVQTLLCVLQSSLRQLLPQYSVILH